MSIKSILTGLSAGLFLAVACAAQTAPVDSSRNDRELYRIGYRDTIEVRVFKHADLSLRYGINPDGTIDLMRSRRPIVAVCKTERELAAEIEAEYESFLRKPEVNVFAVDKVSQSYGVIGAVEKAGNYFVNRRVRLLELLAFAGGPNKEAGNRVIVARTGSSASCAERDNANPDAGGVTAVTAAAGDPTLLNLRLRDVLEAKDNIWMEPGDIVSVLDSDVVYVYGNVNKVGPVRMVEPITLTQAVVSAEGLKPAAKTVVRILRRKGAGDEREEIVVDLREIERRKAADPFLQPDDIVAVSEDSVKSVLRGIAKTFQASVPTVLFRLP